MRYPWILIALGCTGSVGCATVAPTAGVPAGTDASVVVSDEAPTGLPLAAELMYKLLAAEVAGQRNQLNLAVRYYKEVALVTRDLEILRRATRVAAFGQATEDAFALARTWVEIAPNDPEAHQALAALYISQGKPAEAAAEIEKALAVPDTGLDLMKIATVLARQPNQQAAYETMGLLAAKRAKDPVALFAHAHLAMRVGQRDQAIEIIDRALAVKPDWPEAVVLRTRILQMRGDATQALAYIEGVMQREPLAHSLDLQQVHARLLLEAGRLEDARKQYEALLQQSPDDPDALYTIGIISLELKRYDEAEKFFTQLLTQDPQNAESRFFLGQIAEQRERIDEAMHWYQGVNRGQYYSAAQMRIGALIAKQGDLAAARQHLHRIPVDNSEDLLRLYMLEGEILYHAKQYEEAFKVYSEGLEKLPDNNNLLYARALAAEKIGQVDVLERDLRNILAREPEHAHALNALGYTLADRTPRIEEALSYVTRALELRPDDPAILDSMGWVQYRAGKPVEAVKFLQRAHELSPDPEIAAHYGEVLWASGEKDKAREVWRAALQRDPKHELLLETVRRLNQ